MKRSHSYFYLVATCLLFVVGAAFRKGEPHHIEPPAYRIEGITTIDEYEVAIPFTKAGNLILIKAKADTTEGNFILDTGAPNLVLNITYFRDYPAIVADGEQGSITGSGGQVTRTSIRSFALSTLTYDRLEADLVNLGHIENIKKVRILGLLGMELFRDCELIIDFDKNLIHLRRIPKKEPVTFASEQLTIEPSYTTVPIDITDNRIITKIEIGGKKLKFIIDSGAETNILDSRLPNNIFEQVRITGKVTLAGTGKKKIEAVYGEVAEASIEGQKITNLHVLITNLEKTCFAYNGCVDGVLGFDFLNLHKIGFNFVTRKMYLWK